MSPRQPAGSPTNIEVLTFVVADLDGLEGPVHLEHVAARAFELMPGAFRWDLDEDEEHNSCSEERDDGKLIHVSAPRVRAGDRLGVELEGEATAGVAEAGLGRLDVDAG